MDDIFSNILMHKLAAAGGKIRVDGYPISPFFPGLNTDSDTFVGFQNPVDGKRYAAHVFITPAIAKIVNIYNKDGICIDTIPTKGTRASVFYYCRIEDKYINPMERASVMSDAEGIYRVDLEKNPGGKIAKIDLDFGCVILKLAAAIKGTNESGPLFYISRMTIEHLMGYGLMDPRDDKIFRLPMEQICSRTVSALKASEPKKQEQQYSQNVMLNRLGNAGYFNGGR